MNMTTLNMMMNSPADTQKSRHTSPVSARSVNTGLVSAVFQSAVIAGVICLAHSVFGVGFVAQAGAATWHDDADARSGVSLLQQRGPRADRPSPTSSPEPAKADADAKKKDDEKKDEDDDKVKPDRHLAIINGVVFPMSGRGSGIGPVLDGATVLATNGKIAAVGHNIPIPDGAEIIDARGHRVYPGLVAVRSSGIVGGGDPSDTTDVFSLQMALALSAGITTVESGNNAVKLTFGSVDGDEMVLKRNLFVRLRYETSSPSQRRRVREDFERVRNYLRELEAHERAKAKNPKDETLKEPDASFIRGPIAEYRRLIEGQAVASVDSDSAFSLLSYASLAEEFGFRMVVRGGAEAWTVSRELARANAMMIITPRTRQDADERMLRQTGARIQNASILDDRGLVMSFIPSGTWFSAGDGISLMGLAGRDLLHLPMEAAFAVRGGLPPAVAIRAITLDAARILGIHQRVGSLEVGKDADICIKDGDLLSYTTQTLWTIVNGRVVYDKQNDTLFDHIRPDGDLTPPPPEDHWPRRLSDGIAAPERFVRPSQNGSR